MSEDEQFSQEKLQKEIDELQKKEDDAAKMWKKGKFPDEKDDQD
jgi:hypothetical protein